MARKNLNLDIILGAVIVLVFIGFSYVGVSLLEEIERYIYGLEMKLSQTERQGQAKIVLVNIDDKSLARLGQWPWSRNLIADMINILKKNEVRLIGLNLPFIEKEPNQGLVEVKTFHEKFKAYPFPKKDDALTAWILKNLKQMEKGLDNDQKLADSFRASGNVILPAFGRLDSYQKKVKSGKEGPYLIGNFLTSLKIPDRLIKRLSTKDLALPFTELSQNVLGLGHGNSTLNKNMVGRSHPMFIIYRGSLLPSFPLRLAIAYLNQQPGQVVVKKNQIRLKDYSIPINNGEMLIKFKNPMNSFPQYSFVDILQSKKIPPISKGKIILIGLDSSESRSTKTPIFSNMSGGVLTAYILDNIINKNFIIRPFFIAYIEIFTILILGGFALFILPRIGQIGKLGLLLGLAAVTLMTGMILFFMVDIWFKTVYILGCLVMIYLLVSARELLFTEKITKESMETNRLLGLNFQSQGLLDLAFEKFRKLPLDSETKDLIYNLGLEYEQKRMINKSISVYEYIYKGGEFRDLDKRISRLKESDKSSTLASHSGGKAARLLADSTEARSTVGRYKILGELGKGSMGLVYKAQDPKINRLLAIKTICFSDEFEEEVLQEIKERFVKEAEIAGKLSHPSIVTIHDVGEDRDLTYMAMEYLAGKDLEKFISMENLLPFNKVLDIVARIADALDFAHKAGVIHRDIKPANIMLINNGAIKVTDFGIAKAISSSRTKTGVILGTPNYMAPEQIMGQKIDPRSDIFSLGVLFYQLLTGKLPFHGDNLSSLLYQITQVKHPPVQNYNPRIPKACGQIIDKAMAKNPEERFRTAGEMAKYIKLLASKIDQLKKKILTKKPGNNHQSMITGANTMIY